MTTGEREPESSGLPQSRRTVPPPQLMPTVPEVRASWINFYDTHYPRVMRFVMHSGACLQDAQDAVQEAFTESWTLMNSNPDRWSEVSRKEAWIRVVAWRRYLRPPGPRIRPPVADGAVIPDLPDPGLGPSELTTQTQMVLQTLRGLDEDERVVMAFYLDDFPTEEIATALNLTEQRVRDIKKKARAALKIALAGHMSPGRKQPQ
jgi:RNA polymerase sigma factor (sigma-70 family)